MEYKLRKYKKFKIGDKLKHKHCSLMKEIIGFEYDLFDTYVIVKIIDQYNWKNIGHYYGKKQKYLISILQEYKKMEN